MTEQTAEEFWKGRCIDCAHPLHPLKSCHEIVGGSMPGDGPEYCPCAVEMVHMEMALDRLVKIEEAATAWRDASGLFARGITASRLRTALGPPLSPEFFDPEATCQRCGRPNARAWHAPSPLWNAVMRDRETGDDRFGIVCPPCFAEMAVEAGVLTSPVWHFAPHEVDIAALWPTTGRVWDGPSLDFPCLWYDVAARAPAHDIHERCADCGRLPINVRHDAPPTVGGGLAHPFRSSRK